MRSSYYLLPDPRRTRRWHADEETVLRDALAFGGSQGLAVVARDLLRREVTGRASCPAEVRLLREGLDVAVSEEVTYWTEGLARLEAREVEASEPPSEPLVIAVTCASCGAIFGRLAGARGRPRTRCHDCYAPRSS